MKEIWKDIENYKGLYQVSNLGKIKNKWNISKGTVDSNGYCVVTLTKNHKQKVHKVHRLVAKAFIPNPNNLPMINHKDEIKHNNCATNLEWCTAKYNNNYGNYKKKMSESCKGRIITKETRNKISETRKGRYIGSENPAFGTNTNGHKIICLNDLKVYPSARKAGIKLNIDNSSISKICKGIRKSIHGYKFMYYKDYIENTEITTEIKRSVAL